MCGSHTRINAHARYMSPNALLTLGYWYVGGSADCSSFLFSSTFQRQQSHQRRPLSLWLIGSYTEKLNSADILKTRLFKLAFDCIFSDFVIPVVLIIFTCLTAQYKCNRWTDDDWQWWRADYNSVIVKLHWAPAVSHIAMQANANVWWVTRSESSRYKWNQMKLQWFKVRSKTD